MLKDHKGSKIQVSQCSAPLAGLEGECRPLGTGGLLGSGEFTGYR